MPACDRTNNIRWRQQDERGNLGEEHASALRKRDALNTTFPSPEMWLYPVFEPAEPRPCACLLDPAWSVFFAEAWLLGLRRDNEGEGELLTKARWLSCTRGRQAGR